MHGRRRVLGRVVVTLLGAVLGVVLMSGSDQPVTAHAYPRWQELAAPPLAPRADALGLRVGRRVLVLGGVGVDGRALSDGASYDLRTGTWRRLRAPTALSARDRAVAAAGVVVVRHAMTGHAVTWWRYDPRRDTWSLMDGCSSARLGSVGVPLGGVRRGRSPRGGLQRAARPLDPAAGRPPAPAAQPRAGARRPRRHRGQRTRRRIALAGPRPVGRPVLAPPPTTRPAAGGAAGSPARRRTLARSRSDPARSPAARGRRCAGLDPHPLRPRRRAAPGARGGDVVDGALAPVKASPVCVVCVVSSSGAEPRPRPVRPRGGVRHISLTGHIPVALPALLGGCNPREAQGSPASRVSRHRVSRHPLTTPSQRWRRRGRRR